MSQGTRSDLIDDDDLEPYDRDSGEHEAVSLDHPLEELGWYSVVATENPGTRVGEVVRLGIDDYGDALMACSTDGALVDHVHTRYGAWAWGQHGLELRVRVHLVAGLWPQSWPGVEAVLAALDAARDSFERQRLGRLPPSSQDIRRVLEIAVLDALGLDNSRGAH